MKPHDLPPDGFSNQRLAGVDFRDAPLRGADFKGAYLRDTDFRGADLQEANFTDAKGLLPARLAGAHLANATLPATIPAFGDLEALDEASKNARTLFITTLGACIYSWLTIATTTDSALLINNVSSPLPVISTLIPIVTFYYFSPLVLLCLHIYFLFCLQVVWNLLAKLPAVFPDGIPLERKSFPWLLTDLVVFHFRHLRRNLTALSYTQRILSVFLAWYLVPVTLLLFWFRYLPARDLGGSLWHVLVIAFELFFAISLHSLAIATLRFKSLEREARSLQTSAIDARLAVRGIALRIAAAVAVALLLCYCSIGIVNGKWSDDRELRKRPKQFQHLATFLRPRSFMPWLAATLGLSSLVKPNLVSREVSTKPASWTGGDNQVDSVRGADLSFRDLSFADCYEVFAPNARFVEADLRGAKFGSSDLRKSDLSRALGDEATFTRARLANTRFGASMMRRTKFYGAQLDQTTFTSDFLRSRLAGPNNGQAMLGFGSSDFSEADFTYAEIDRCDFRSTFFARSRFLVARIKATDFAGSDLSNAHFTGASISSCDFTDTKLYGSSFDRANLTSVVFDGARLADPSCLLVAVFSNTRLSGVDFSKARDIEFAVFTGALYDKTTKWPASFDPIQAGASLDPSSAP